MFGACLTQAWYQKALEKEITQGNALGVQGTPSVFINNSQMNFKSSEEFFKILDALGQKQ
jgi:protein-disulfide isomerase